MGDQAVTGGDQGRRRGGRARRLSMTSIEAILTSASAWRVAAFVLSGQASASGDPGVGALDDPASGQDAETFLSGRFGDDLDVDTEAFGAVGEGVLVPGVDPHLLKVRASLLAHRFGQHREPAGVVRDRRGGDHHVDDQTQGVDQDVTLASVDALAGVIPARVSGPSGRLRLACGGSPARPTVGAATTDWESITPAVGNAERTEVAWPPPSPCSSGAAVPERTASCKASWIASSVPSALQVQK